ncbi:ABC transporter permease subunit [uncultured Oscillibacter sp.]|uniref:ABC transporter permease subunit n=1 Tax=uncultured Oscillibacter sp. TaxID=876091 RepID=UPI0025FEE105|nr:ABC transporter permease subunit [uncultured Oscillibacter sp.]
MRRIIIFELKKMLMRPVSILALILLIAINCLSIFTDGMGTLILPEYVTAQKTEQSKYAGRMDKNWTDEIQQRLNVITEDHKNLIQEDEREQVRKEYLEKGYTQQYIDSLSNSVFLKPEITDSLTYRVLKDAEYSSTFYTKAKDLSIALGKYYRSEYLGKKGEVLAQKAEKMYGYLAQKYIAFYDYNLGWNKLISLQKLLPFTVGFFLLIALSSAFSGEYSGKTDSLLMSSKHGKGKLIHAKIMAAFFLAVGIWLLMQLLSLILVDSVFSLEGSQALVQDWQFNTCPFAFTQRTNYLAVCGMSITGILIFTAVILFISVKTKNPFITLLISGTFLMTPVIANIPQIGSFIKEIFTFAPVNILIAADHFTFFKAYYFFGHALMMQVVVPITAIIISGMLIPFVYKAFQRHQIEN